MAMPDTSDDSIRSLDRPARRRGVLSRLSAGHVLMIVAGLLAALVNFSLLQSRDQTFLAAVAADGIIPGQTVTLADFRTEEIRATPALLDTLVLQAELAEIEGRVATRGIGGGELIQRSDFQDAAAPLELRAMSIPVSTDLAVGGAIRPDDLVDIVHVNDRVATFVATGVPVLAVPSTETGGLGGASSYHVTVAVDAATSLRIASALDRGTLMLVRATGADAPESLTFDPGADLSGEPSGGEGAPEG